MPDFDVRVTHRESGDERIVRVKGARDGEHARERAATDDWLAGPASPADASAKPMAVMNAAQANPAGDDGPSRLLTRAETEQWKRIIAAGVFRGTVWIVLVVALLVAALWLLQTVLKG